MPAAVSEGVRTMQKPGDELLVAYLDGELDESRRAEIEAWLEHDSAARDQVAPLSASTNSWLDNVAGYHKLFVAAAQGENSFADIPAAGDGGEVIQKISQRTAQPGVRVPNLKPWGLIFQGARVVIIEGRPAAQLVYTADNEAVGSAIGPLTLVIGSAKRAD